MKQLFLYSLALVAVCALFGSCTTDKYDPSDGKSDLFKGTLAAAPYTNEAKCLKLQNATIDGRTLRYIELTSSGYYFLTFEGNINEQGYNAPGLHSNRTRSTEYKSRVMQGVFKVLGPDSYELKDFGVITLKSNDTAKITLDNGEEFIWNTTDLEHISSNALNNRLCRTWNLIGAHIDFLDEEKNVIYTLNISQDTLYEEYVDAVVFTEAGKYYELDDNEWIVGDWIWSDAHLQIVMCTFADEDGDGGDGMFQVLFDDDTIEVMMPNYFFNEGEAIEEYRNLPGGEDIPMSARYAREYIKLKALN